MTRKSPAPAHPGANQPSFVNPTVIPCRPGDHRLVAFGYSETSVSFEQTEDGPTFLVIGHQSPASAIERGCRRFGLDIDRVRTDLARQEDGNQPCKPSRIDRKPKRQWGRGRP